MILAEEVAIRPMRAGNDIEVGDLLKLYEDSIPASERKSPDALKRMLDTADYLVLGAFIGKQLVGFLVVHLFRGRALYLLEYMGVASGWRGQGIGRRLFDKLLAIKTDAEPLLMEVDSDHHPSTDHEQRVARKRFYRKLGCREVSGLAYELPLPGAPPPMDLLVHWNSRRRVELATVKEWLTALYVDVYGQAENDPRIGEMVGGGLPDEVRLV